jgi:hypothetical protein
MPSTAFRRRSGLTGCPTQRLEYLLLKRQIGDQTLEVDILSRFIRLA